MVDKTKTQLRFKADEDRLFRSFHPQRFAEMQSATLIPSNSTRSTRSLEHGSFQVIQRATSPQLLLRYPLVDVSSLQGEKALVISSGGTDDKCHN
jgi:hypothetical protein